LAFWKRRKPTNASYDGPTASKAFQVEYVQSSQARLFEGRLIKLRRSFTSCPLWTREDASHVHDHEWHSESLRSINKLGRSAMSDDSVLIKLRLEFDEDSEWHRWINKVGLRLSVQSQVPADLGWPYLPVAFTQSASVRPSIMEARRFPIRPYNYNWYARRLQRGKTWTRQLQVSKPAGSESRWAYFGVLCLNFSLSQPLTWV
jgi:hypothetical protein